MKAWLRETHSPFFELLRHFLHRFFDSDLITHPENTAPALAGVFAMILPWITLLVQPLKQKYSHFSHLSDAAPYLRAVRADQLWLLTLNMAAIGLLVSVRWDALFPSRLDYHALGSLPLRTRQLFFAKLAALLAVATAAIAVLAALPSLLFPAVSASHWQINPSVSAHVLAHAVATVAGCYFFFFALVALQGLLLNLLPPRTFERVAGILQGTLTALTLLLLVLSFSIRPRTADFVLRPELARWIPPVWFLGLYQTLLGDPAPAMHALARRAGWALAIAAAVAMLSYLVSYRRHRKLLVEGLALSTKNHRWAARLFPRLVRDPRQQAITAFLWKTLAGSSRHRMVLMAYAGFGAAIVLTGILEMKDVAAAFIYAHIVVLTFLLIGVRHLFSIPCELRANWTFQISERQGRIAWMRAVDRFVLSLGAVAMLLLPLPVEYRLLGWHAPLESAVVAAFGLLCYEAVFVSWDKLPFTCSSLPGKTPLWIKSLQLLALVTALDAVHHLLLLCLELPALYAVIFAAMLVAAVLLRRQRVAAWSDFRLKYDEAPEPAVQALNLLR